MSMKSLVSGLAVVLLSTALVYAQKAPIKFGDVPIEDVQMKTYDKDSSAAAVVLADYGQTKLEYHQEDGFYLTFERVKRIKILTKDGLEWGNFTIPLYHSGSDEEKLTGLKGITYNIENGKAVESKLKNDAIMKEKADANVDLVKITMPNVREGSVVEITYGIASDFLFNLQDWDFQYTIPARLSEYRVNIPEYFYYEKFMQGYIKLDVVEQKQAPSSIIFNTKTRSEGYAPSTSFSSDKVDFMETRYRWAAQNVPAFKTEPNMTTYKDYISRMNFELSYTKFPNSGVKNYMGSWADINKQYAESSDFGGEVTGNGFLKKTVEEIIAGATSPEAQISALHNYVRTNIQWDGYTRKFVNTSLRKVMDEKKGNSAEINLLLASMLEKAGFDVRPVLISTRDNGFVREATPISSQFNNVICLVRFGDKQVLLDATDKLLPAGHLPERYLNGNGLAISSKNGFSWVNLMQATKSKRFLGGEVKLDQSGKLIGKLTFDNAGYFGTTNRRQYLSKGEEEYVKALNNAQWEITKSEFENAKVLDAPFKETYELTINDYVTMAGDMIYLNPHLAWHISENPYKLEKREYPVDFGSPYETTYSFRLIIPDGYVVEELPKNKMLALPNNGARYVYSASQVGNAINFTSTLAMNKPLFTQEEYPTLREFYNQVVAKQAEQIVLKKK